eukprot:s3867_g9.t1
MRHKQEDLDKKQESRLKQGQNSKEGGLKQGRERASLGGLKHSQIIDSAFCLAAWPKEATAADTWTEVFDVLAWSFQSMWKGCHPTEDWKGKPLTGNLAAMAGKPLTSQGFLQVVHLEASKGASLVLLLSKASLSLRHRLLAEPGKVDLGCWIDQGKNIAVSAARHNTQKMRQSDQPETGELHKVSFTVLGMLVIKQLTLESPRSMLGPMRSKAKPPVESPQRVVLPTKSKAAPATVGGETHPGLLADDDGFNLAAEALERSWPERSGNPERQTRSTAAVMQQFGWVTRRLSGMQLG